MKLIAYALFVILISPAFVLAWGGDGHQITCLIAEDRLTPAAKADIHSLLGNNVNISDGEIASWADEIRRSRTETGPWHYVNIPVGSNGFDEARDGNQGNNVIDKVGEFANVLNNPNAKKATRAEALKFLVHLVGDMHQPLHCADRNKDRGGNSRLVFFLNQPQALNLHSVWDGAILNVAKGTMRNADYAKKLNAAIAPADAAEWIKGNPIKWGNESFQVAVDSVYKGVPADGPPPKLNQKYVNDAIPIVEKQLQRGGVRLAMILNKVLK